MPQRPRQRPPAPLVPPKPVDRITYLLNFHHEHAGDKPTSIEHVSQKIMETHEQPWVRRLTIGEQRVLVSDLKGCWLEPDQIGYICIESLVGKGGLVNPSQAELSLYATKVLEVSITPDPAIEDCFLVPPSFPFLGWSKTGLLYVRCQSGDAECRITVFPK